MDDEPFTLRKLEVQPGDEVRYVLRVGELGIELNRHLGDQIRLVFTGRIHCLACGQLTRKSFNQGYCYRCFSTLASCDRCIVSPERCHYHQGTCRQPEWGESHCMQPHIVYLANSSGLKVGITRKVQVPTRWIDQGAVQALAVLEVPTRLDSGRAEVTFKQHVADRTDWRRMLRSEPDAVDLPAARDELLASCAAAIAHIDGAARIADATPHTFLFPVRHYPRKVTSHNLDRTRVIEGTLQGIKGQYLILDSGVFNIRRHAGYEVTARWHE